MDRLRNDTEFAQAIVRFPVGSSFVVATFMFAKPELGPVYAAVYGILGWATLIYWLVAVWIAVNVYHFSGQRHWRRQTALIIDNCAIGLLMMTGAETMLPAFAGLLWVTVGFGMRYGPGYLMLSIAAALVTCVAVAMLNPWWRDHPAIPATLVFSILVTPTYAFFLHARLRKAQLATEAASLAKSRFLAQVSHDLRQPLHAMSLMSAGIADASTPEVRRDLAARIDRSVHDARELLQTFLERSIIETGRLNASPNPFSLGALLRELEQVNHAVAQWDGTRLRFVQTSVWVDADRAFVRTMIQNLIANALRVARGRSIVVGCRRRPNGLTLTVVDSGPGIDPDYMAQVADPMADPGHLADGRFGGTGLGLSIVWQLAQKHGLVLRYQAVQGKGTAFHIDGLPIISTVPPADPDVIPVTPLTGARVLLIGVDEAARAATAQLLTGWGCSVEQWARLPIEQPDSDLLVLDLESRHDAAPLTQWAAPPPVLAMTSHREHVARRWLGQCPALLAAKPVTAAELRSLVMAALTQARQSRQAVA